MQAEGRREGVKERPGCAALRAAGLCWRQQEARGPQQGSEEGVSRSSFKEFAEPVCCL